MTNAQSPYADQTPKEHLDRVMHARLEIGADQSLYAGDCPPGMLIDKYGCPWIVNGEMTYAA